MRFNRVRGCEVCVVVALAAILVLSGCAGTCGVKDTVVKETGVTLEYRMDGDEALSYRQSNDMTQIMEVQGQSIPVESTETLEFSVLASGMDDGTLRLGVTVDNLSVVASSPQGNIEADVSDVTGKSFDMTLTRLGEEGALPESDLLVYALEPQGPRSLVPVFGAMFPDLPDYAVEIGDTWPASLEIKDDTGGTNLRVALEAVNTLEGFETFAGYDCARITSVFTGVIEGSGNKNGVDWSLESVSDGTGIWYFAHKEGILVSDVTDGTADGSIIVNAPDGEMVMPISRVYTMSTELVQ